VSLHYIFRKITVSCAQFAALSKTVFLISFLKKKPLKGRCLQLSSIFRLTVIENRARKKMFLLKISLVENHLSKCPFIGGQRHHKNELPNSIFQSQKPDQLIALQSVFPWPAANVVNILRP